MVIFVVTLAKEDPPGRRLATAFTVHMIHSWKEGLLLEGYAQSSSTGNEPDVQTSPLSLCRSIVRLWAPHLVSKAEHVHPVEGLI